MAFLISARAMASICNHTNEDSATELSETSRDDEIITLRVCGVGDSAFYEFINEMSDPVSEVFDEIDIKPVSLSIF